MIKKWTTIVLVIMSIIFLYGCQNGEMKMDELKITCFDVGKGDAILLEYEGETLLIDSGYDKTAPILLEYLRKEGIEHISYFVITHFDKDHVGGADKLLHYSSIGEIFQPNYESDSKQYEEYEDELENQEKEPTIVTEALEIAMGDVKIVIDPPDKKKYKEEDNDFSLAISVTHEENRFLFTGDAEKERIKELLKQEDFELAHTLLKIPHHGNYGKNSDEFIKAVNPSYAWITDSREEPADEEMLELLEELECKTYQTQNGRITCMSDGKTLTMMQ